MPELRVRVSDKDYADLVKKAEMEGKTVQDYVREILFGVNTIFTPSEAMRRAKKIPRGERFTLPDLYTEAEWSVMSRGPAGAFGKKFFFYAKDDEPGVIKYCYGGDKGRRAVYERL